MGIVGKILNALTKQYHWDPRGMYWNTSEHHPKTDPATIHIGDIVEYAIEWPENIQYKVEQIDSNTHTAYIRAIAGTVFSQERYPAPLSMLRKVKG